jgi:hypothetical protein
MTLIASRTRHSCGSRNLDVVPAKAGNQYLAYWIPPYQVRGRLSHARNDKLLKTHVVMYNLLRRKKLTLYLYMQIKSFVKKVNMKKAVVLPPGRINCFSK